MHVAMEKKTFVNNCQFSKLPRSCNN